MYKPKHCMYIGGLKVPEVSNYSKHNDYTLNIRQKHALLELQEETVIIMTQELQMKGYVKFIHLLLNLRYEFKILLISPEIY